MNNISVSALPYNNNSTTFKGNPKSLVKGVAAGAKEVGMSESQIIDGLSDEVQMLIFSLKVFILGFVFYCNTL